MRPVITALAFLVLPLVSFAQAWKTFTDTAGMFTAKYPPDWINKIKEGNRVFFTSPDENDQDRFHENINISVSYRAGYGTEVKVKDIFPSVTTGLAKQFTDFKQESLRFFKWNNADAAEIIYSGYNKLDESLKVRTTQWYCFYKSRLYLATFVASYENNALNETARKIMSGIVFK